LFIFFFWFLFNLVKKPKKKTEEKPKEKVEKKEEPKQEIPEILKEVTMGNYMHDISSVPDASDGLVMQEADIEDDKNKESSFDIEKEFDYIENQGNEINAIFDDGIEEIEDDIEGAEDIDNFDQELFDNEYNDQEENIQSVADEIKKSSITLKSLLIANILDKKQK